MWPRIKEAKSRVRKVKKNERKSLERKWRRMPRECKGGCGQGQGLRGGRLLHTLGRGLDGELRSGEEALSREREHLHNLSGNARRGENVREDGS